MPVMFVKKVGRWIISRCSWWLSIFRCRLINTTENGVLLAAARIFRVSRPVAYQAGTERRKRYTSTQSLPRRGRGVNATLRPLYPEERNPVPIAQDAGWSSKTVCMSQKNFAPTGVRTPDCPASSQSLNCLRYRGCLTIHAYTWMHKLKK